MSSGSKICCMRSLKIHRKSRMWKKKMTRHLLQIRNTQVMMTTMMMMTMRKITTMT